MENGKSSDSPLAGTEINQYQILEKLGSGGMGEVYLAEDTRLNRKVALKFLPVHFSSDKALNTRFITEAQAAAKLNHPHIITIFEVNEYDGRPFFAMEYVEGKPLSEIIREGELQPDRAVDITLQICEGLKEAHKKGIIHRDIKPSNIIIDENGRCRILDFGLAAVQSEERLTNIGALLGTVEYMSPERVRGEMANNCSDIFSLGVLFYEMLTGKLPFKGDFVAGVVYSIINEIPERLDKYRSDIPEGFQYIIDKALEKDLNLRYQNIGDFIYDLKNLKSELVHDSPVIDLPSIAVLPFKDMSPQKDQEYFCDGISEEIINVLAHIEDLRVVARTSSFSFKGKDIDIRELGKKLSVTSVLEGSVRKAGNRLRITAQLINVSDGYHIWSESYDSEMEDIFDIQGGIAKNIAMVLKLKLSQREKEQIEKKPTDSLTAYDYCIKGREYYYRYHKQDNENAIKLFKKALEFDPKYGHAYAGLADAYIQRANMFGFGPKWIDVAIEISREAISIDSNCAEVYKSLGLASAAKGLYKNALESYFKTIELNPNNFSATVNIGLTYSFTGQFDKALQWMRKGVALNPTLAYSNWVLGEIYMALSDFDKAEKWFNKALELEPNFIRKGHVLFELYMFQGKSDKAERYSREILSANPDNVDALFVSGLARLFAGDYTHAANCYQRAMKSKALPINEIILSAELAHIFMKTGQSEKSRQMSERSLSLAQQLQAAGDERWEIPFNIAAVYAIKGEKENAYLYLQKAFEAGWRNYKSGSMNPMFENLREDDRFKKILSDVKLIVDEMRIKAERYDR